MNRDNLIIKGTLNNRIKNINTIIFGSVSKDKLSFTNRNKEVVNPNNEYLYIDEKDKDIYIWLNDKYELVDLSNDELKKFYTKEETNKLLDLKASNDRVDELHQQVESISNNDIPELNRTKLDKAQEQEKVYGTDGLGNQTTLQYNQEPYGNGIAQRTSNGRLKGTAPTENNDLVNKEYFDTNKGYPIIQFNETRPLTQEQLKIITDNPICYLMDVYNKSSIYIKNRETDEAIYFIYPKRSGVGDGGNLDYIVGVYKQDGSIFRILNKFMINDVTVKDNSLRKISGFDKVVGEDINFKTVGGQSIFGTGDIPAGGAGGGVNFEEILPTTIDDKILGKWEFNKNFSGLNYLKTETLVSFKSNGKVFSKMKYKNTSYPNFYKYVYYDDEIACDKGIFKDNYKFIEITDVSQVADKEDLLNFLTNNAVKGE